MYSLDKNLVLKQFILFITLFNIGTSKQLIANKTHQNFWNLMKHYVLETWRNLDSDKGVKMKQETAQVRQENWIFAGLYIPVNRLNMEICGYLCVFLSTFRLSD